MTHYFRKGRRLDKTKTTKYNKYLDILMIIYVGLRETWKVLIDETIDMCKETVKNLFKKISFQVRDHTSPSPPNLEGTPIPLTPD